MEKRTDMRAEALDTLIDIERNKKLSHIAIGGDTDAEPV